LDDVSRGHFTSAGAAARRALQMRPFDEGIQLLFREVEQKWREFHYSRQDWRDAYLTASIAFEAGDPAAAAIALLRVQDKEASLAPSFRE
jgi:hypothetical protein